MRVLVADDSRDTLMTLGILLRSEGHQVWSAQGGTEVAGAVRAFKPGLVLLHLNMAHRSGYEVAQDLRREHGAACPVLVALTGKTDGAAEDRAKLAGFQHFIPKPYKPASLLALVGDVDREMRRQMDSTLRGRSVRALRP